MCSRTALHALPFEVLLAWADAPQLCQGHRYRGLPLVPAAVAAALVAVARGLRQPRLLQAAWACAHHSQLQLPVRELQPMTERERVAPHLSCAPTKHLLLSQQLLAGLLLLWKRQFSQQQRSCLKRQLRSH